ncbi:MAG: hypothetical protein ACJ71M_09955, partial [Nitrososphaeraceae archaeon]
YCLPQIQSLYDDFVLRISLLTLVTYSHKRLLSRYTFTEAEEKVISILDVTGTNALVKIYDRMTSGFEFVTSIKKGNIARS